mgnify:FL=1
MDAFKKELESYGSRVILQEGDISKPEVAENLIKTAIDNFGRIDILLNVAGISNPKLLIDMYHATLFRYLQHSILFSLGPPPPS